ncbi:MAG: hypothetical protein ACE5GH_04645, partial [Fidelibacterota bacterium]
MKIHRSGIFVIFCAVYAWGQGQRTFQGMNPNIGVIGDFSYENHLNSSGQVGQFQFQEAEISFRMVLDPFARADYYVAVVPPEEAVELEEGFITLFSLPMSIQARIGHFRNAFGKFNLTHPPETPLTTTPLHLQHYFGDEGLAETGVSLSTLVANPWDLFAELSFDLLGGENEVSFGGGNGDRFSYLWHLKSFIDISENSNVEFGLSTMAGPNDSLEAHTTRLFGGDLIYRWKPLAMGQYRSFTLQSEVLYSGRQTGDGEVNSYAVFLFSQVQVAKRWFVGLSYDYAGFPDRKDDLEARISALATLWPSEFQTLKLQFSQTHRNFVSPKKVSSVYFQ